MVETPLNNGEGEAEVRCMLLILHFFKRILIYSLGPQIWHIHDSGHSEFWNFLDFGSQFKMINEDQESVINSPFSKNKMLKFKMQKDIINISSVYQ